MIKIFVMTLITVVVALPASAQMGTSNNPPPQRLFDTGPSQQLNNGLGTMAALEAHRRISVRAHPRSEAAIDWSSKITSLTLGSRIKVDSCGISALISDHSDPAALRIVSVNA